MTLVRKEDIGCFIFEGEYVCVDCLNEGDQEISEKDIMTAVDAAESKDFIFCNRCQQRIS